MKVNKPDLMAIMDNQKIEIDLLRAKIYELTVENEYLKLKLADAQISEDRRLGLSLMSFDGEFGQ